MTAVLVNDFATGQTEAFTLELEGDMDDVAFYKSWVHCPLAFYLFPLTEWLQK